MSNHYHLLLEATVPTLSAGTRQVNGGSKQKGEAREGSGGQKKRYVKKQDLILIFRHQTSRVCDSVIV
ncbi:MAG: hypothetical protein PHC68_10130 [Syntrophorhabdaceae bacterium]|nr:hypothetical protein [Syntrophorhabdaceae bacterium]